MQCHRQILSITFFKGFHTCHCTTICMSHEGERVHVPLNALHCNCCFLKVTQHLPDGCIRNVEGKEVLHSFCLFWKMLRVIAVT